MEHNYLMILQGKNVVCQKHIEGVKTDREAAQFINLMLKETFADKLFKDFCGNDAAKGIPASVEKIPEVLPGILPLCCFLGDIRVDGLKQQIKLLPQQRPKPNIEDRIFTPIAFIKSRGWKQAETFTDRSQAISYAKGFSDARRKIEVVILDLSDSNSDVRQFEIWTRKIEDGSFPAK